MADAGFFRGTNSEQDTRFSDKQKKLLKTMKFAEVLSEKVDIKKVKLDTLKPWISQRITELLGLEDEVVVEYVFTQLEAKIVDPKLMQINLTGFLNGKNAREFMRELWELLVSAQTQLSGIPEKLIEAKKLELRERELQHDKVSAAIKKTKDSIDQLNPPGNQGAKLVPKAEPKEVEDRGDRRRSPIRRRSPFRRSPYRSFRRSRTPPPRRRSVSREGRGGAGSSRRSPIRRTRSRSASDKVGSSSPRIAARSPRPSNVAEKVKLSRKSSSSSRSPIARQHGKSPSVEKKRSRSSSSSSESRERKRASSSSPMPLKQKKFSRSRSTSVERKPVKPNNRKASLSPQVRNQKPSDSDSPPRNNDRRRSPIRKRSPLPLNRRYPRRSSSGSPRPTFRNRQAGRRSPIRRNRRSSSGSKSSSSSPREKQNLRKQQSRSPNLPKLKRKSRSSSGSPPRKVIRKSSSRSVSRTPKGPAPNKTRQESGSPRRRFQRSRSRSPRRWGNRRGQLRSPIPPRRSRSRSPFEKRRQRQGSNSPRNKGQRSDFRDRRSSRTPPPKVNARALSPKAANPILKGKPDLKKDDEKAVVYQADSRVEKVAKNETKKPSVARSSDLVEITGSKSGVEKDETLPELKSDQEKPKKAKKSREGKEKKRKHKDKKHKKHKKDRKEKAKKQIENPEAKDVSIEEKLRARALESLRKKE